MFFKKEIIRSPKCQRLLLFVLFYFSTILPNHAQTIRIRSTIVVSSNAQLIANADIHCTSSSDFQNEGTVLLTGDLLNEGLITSDSGTLELIGNDEQAFDGPESPELHHLTLNNPQGLRLETNIEVGGSLEFQQGLLNINNQDIDLGKTGYLTNENELSRVVDDNQTGGPLKGQVISSKGLFPNDTNPGNLGLIISSPIPVPQAIIRRGHDQHILTWSNSIRRYYDVEGANGIANFPIKVTYFDSELNALPENQLVAFRSQDFGSSWTNQLGTINGSTNTLTQTSFPGFSLVTLGTDGYPLPIELLAFSGAVDGEAVVLTWSTASETSNDFFSVERSADLTLWSVVSTVDGAGHSNQKLDYSALDNNPLKGLSYYRLKQTDYNGSHSISSAINILFEVVKADDLRIYPNPSYGRLTCESFGAPIIRIRLIDGRGLSVFAQTSQPQHQVVLRTGGIDAGLYIAEITLNDGPVKTTKIAIR